MPADEVNPSTVVETPGPARVHALRALGIKRVALYSLWLPILLVVLELLASPGLQGLEYFFILLTWLAAIPLTVAITLLHRQTPFCAGVSATILSGATVSSYLWTGVLSVALGMDYWQNGDPSFPEIVIGGFRIVVITVTPSLPAFVMLGAVTWLRRTGHNK